MAKWVSRGRRTLEPPKPRWEQIYDDLDRIVPRDQNGNVQVHLLTPKQKALLKKARKGEQKALDAERKEYRKQGDPEFDPPEKSPNRPFKKLSARLRLAKRKGRAAVDIAKTQAIGLSRKAEDVAGAAKRLVESAKARHSERKAERAERKAERVAKTRTAKRVEKIGRLRQKVQFKRENPPMGLASRVISGRRLGTSAARVGGMRTLAGLGGLAGLGYLAAQPVYDIITGETDLLGPGTRTLESLRLNLENAERQRMQQFRSQQAASLLENARMQQSIQENLQRVAQNNPALYNQIAAGRRLPRGAVVLGGQPRQDLLMELARGMDSGAFQQPDPLSELIG